MQSHSKMILNPCYDTLVSHSSYDERYRSHSPLQTSTPSTIKSQSIPISQGLCRTASEVQLCQDEQVAEQRDYAFYSRVVSGMCQSQGASESYHHRKENQMCLSHIMETRSNGIASDEDEEGWAIGTSLETDCTEKIIRDIIPEAVAITIPSDGEECIFEMDL
jgi:hypothetical protein